MNRSDALKKAWASRAAKAASGCLSLKNKTSNQCVSENLVGIPAKYRGMFQRIYAGTASKSLRIKAKCLDCSCFQRVEVTHCTVKICPLWAARPYQTKQPQAHED